jgi:hypothetical protein
LVSSRCLLNADVEFVVVSPGRKVGDD